MAFSEILKELRLAKGLTQTEVAKGCKVSMQCISSLEMGTRNPTGTTLTALADYFQVSTDYLLGRTDDLGMVSFQSGEASLSAEERELLRRFRALSERSRKVVADMVAAMAGESGAAGGSEKWA